MPKIWEERAASIAKSIKGDYSPEKARQIAYATATKQLQEEGELRKGTRKLTKKGDSKE